MAALKMSTKILLIAGPSGVGKGTIVKRMLDKYGDLLELSVSATTRKIRMHEKHGVEYYFHTTEEFEDHIKKGNLLEWVTFDNNYYGTYKQALDNIFEKKKVVALDLGSFVRNRNPRGSICKKARVRRALHIRERAFVGGLGEENPRPRTKHRREHHEEN